MEDCNTMKMIELILGVVGAVALYYFGFRQGRTAERAYQLSLAHAVPRIGTRMEFVRSGERNIGNQFRYAIETTIYNDGTLVASDLEGNWKLSSSHGFVVLPAQTRLPNSV
jgi:hypothetical protein